MSLWAPSGLQRCSKCQKIAVPPNYTVFGQAVFHDECLTERCDRCGFPGKVYRGPRDRKWENANVKTAR